MSDFSFLKQLMDLEDLSTLEEAVDVSPLKNSAEFKEIQKKYPDLADGLELSWGYPEFYKFIRKVFDGAQIGDKKYNNVDKDTKVALGVLTKLHMEKFGKFNNDMKKTIQPDVWGPEYERGFFKEMLQTEITAFKEQLKEAQLQEVFNNDYDEGDKVKISSGFRSPCSGKAGIVLKKLSNGKYKIKVGNDAYELDKSVLSLS